MGSKWPKSNEQGLDSAVEPLAITAENTGEGLKWFDLLTQESFLNLVAKSCPNRFEFNYQTLEGTFLELTHVCVCMCNPDAKLLKRKREQSNACSYIYLYSPAVSQLFLHFSNFIVFLV